MLDGPPAWIATPAGAYLVDGRVRCRERRSRPRAPSTERRPGPPPGLRTHGARCAVPDARRSRRRSASKMQPSRRLKSRSAGRAGALIAQLTFIDRATGARAPYAPLGAIAPHGERFVRFTSRVRGGTARALAERPVSCRARDDGFALHGADRAAHFVRETLPQLDGFGVPTRSGTERSRAAARRRSTSASVPRGRRSDADWFELKVDVLRRRHRAKP